MTAALHVKHLDKTIRHKGKEVFRLEDINLQVKRGDLFALLGPNGSGKTTLINLILGLLKPDRGEITIFGKNPLEREALTKVNFLFTDQEEPPALRVKDILSFYADVYGIQNKKKKIVELAKLLNLESKMEQPLYRLSSGERTRAMIARALINAPQLLILDEPTHNLDTYTAEKLRRFLLKLNKQGTTILFTSHHIPEIEKIARTIAFIKKGKIVEINSLKNIRRKYKSIRQFMLRKTK